MREKKHKEWATINYYTKVSKYDLDRANVDMNTVQQEKKIRRVFNARAKKLLIDQDKKLHKFVSAVEKINKIHEVISIKQEGLQQRRSTAIKH